ncbi:MAG TPA: TIGR00282 family metallophosphoesterase [Trueperaceae bacterium]
MKILFIGDIVGASGLEFLEEHLPHLRARYAPDFIVANAENLSITGTNPVSGCGMASEDINRLFGTGVDLVTGGNHSWDGPAAEAVHCDPRVLRPLNYGPRAPGRGAAVLEKNGSRLGVVNLASRTALAYVDQPHDVLERQLDDWNGDTDAVLVDFHGESVSEKQIFAWSFAGRVAAVVGTHTHVATLDSRVLPGGTAFVTDVGMTGPSGGMQGYDPELFLDVIRTRLPSRKAGKLASGPVELGAVLIQLDGGKATAIDRIRTPKGELA